MVVFGLQPEISDMNTVIHIDDIALYQAGRYISVHEVVWLNHSFPTHAWIRVFFHLAVRLEHEQYVYFTAETVQQIALNQLAKTLTASFSLRKHGCISKCLCITHGLRIQNYLNHENEESESTHTVDKLTIDRITNGRLYTIHFNRSECFFLRVFLAIINAAKHCTFSSACQALKFCRETDTGIYGLMAHATRDIQIKFLHRCYHIDRLFPFVFHKVIEEL